jgi:hypothetical protein
MVNKKKILNVLYAPSLRELIELFNEGNSNATNPILREDIINIIKDDDTGLFYLTYCK